MTVIFKTPLLKDKKLKKIMINYDTSNNIFASHFLKKKLIVKHEEGKRANCTVPRGELIKMLWTAEEEAVKSIEITLQVLATLLRKHLTKLWLSISGDRNLGCAKYTNSKLCQSVLAVRLCKTLVFPGTENWKQHHAVN